MRELFTRALLSVLALTSAGAADAAVVPPAGYIYSTQLLGNTTQSCIAAGPGGTFVGVGPTFTANAQSVVLAKESGEVRLVASGFNSIGDCAYDATADVLYVTDNGADDDFGTTGIALSGDTVFAIPSASTASGLSAPGLELLPADSVPDAGSVAVDVSGDVFVADSTGPTDLGSVIKIVGGTPSTFQSNFDYTAGIAINAANGNVFIAETLGTFDAQISLYTSAGAAVPPVPFAGPSFTLGSYDLAFNADGRLLVTGAFAGDVLSFNPTDASSVPFVSGLTFASGITVDPFTHRVQILSGTFPVTDENKSLHRFTPVAALSEGGGSPSGDCLLEAYGVQVVDGAATCTDGAACDSDGKVNDACLFPLGFCLNVSDPDLAGCSTASNIIDVAIGAKPATAAIAAVTAQISSALPLTGSSCFFSDGVYVPVRITGSGEKKNGQAKVKIKVTAADDRKDSDSVKLVCQPAP